MERVLMYILLRNIKSYSYGMSSSLVSYVIQINTTHNWTYEPTKVYIRTNS